MTRYYRRHFARGHPRGLCALLLRDVFDADYEQIARVLGRSHAACRKLVERARGQVQLERRRFVPSSALVCSTLQAFAAATAGDTGPLAGLLAEDARMLTEGGGKASAATRPVLGKSRVLRFIAGVLRKNPWPENGAVETGVNGLPGLVLYRNGVAAQTFACELHGETLVAIYSIRNPDKLAVLPTCNGSPREFRRARECGLLGNEPVE